MIATSKHSTVVESCQLPELDDVFNLSAETGHRTFIFEFKHLPSTAAIGGSRLAEEVESAGLSRESWISSVSDGALRSAQDVNTEVKLMRVRPWTGSGAVTDLWIDAANSQGFDGINVNLEALRSEKITKAKELGLVVSAWEWPDALEAHNQTAIDMGVDMFMTDRLEDLIARMS